MEDFRYSKLETRIAPALLTQVYNRAGIAVIGTVINASILTYILWGLIPASILVVWLALTLATTGARFMLIEHFRGSADTIRNLAIWKRWLVLGLAVSGALWGASGIFLFPVESTAHQAFIAFLLAGMVAGAVGVFSPVMPAFLAFSIPALLPITIRFILIGDPMHLAMAFMTMLFGVLTFATAKRLNASTRELVMLKETFANRLTQRTAELQRLNDQFRLEIAERKKTEQVLKTTEAQIAKSLEEKTILLQEIHHRVKNNMQVIVSLMHLQAAQIEDQRLKLSFREASSRVNAMALVHNILYESDPISEIDLSDYFKRLTGILIRMYNADGIQITISADGCRLNMDQAIPCGLIINELISNALKHAFPEQSGRIRIEAHPCDPDHYMLTVQDNGVGLPEHIDLPHTKTLGLKLVNGLAVQQLGGRIEVDRARQGTTFKLQFKREA